MGKTTFQFRDLEEAVEMEFLKVLAATRRWRIVDGTLTSRRYGEAEP